MKHSTRVGVIGTGYWGQQIIRICAELGVLAAVCDTNPEKLKAVAENYPNCPGFDSVDEMLRAPVDAVIVATPAKEHARLALAALCAGKQVFLEKPMALNIEDASEIARVARALQATVFVGQILLYHPAVRKMLSLLRENAIGDLRHFRSRRWSLGRLRARENVWWRVAPQDVAVMLEAFGEFPQSARSTHHGYTQPGISDFAYVDYLFSKRRSAHIEVGWLEAAKGARLDVFGTTGILTFEESAQGAHLTLTPCGMRYGEGGAVSPWRADAQPVPFERAEPLRLELETFLEAVAARTIPMTSVREGVHVVRALVLADESAQYNVAREEVYA